jgi:hypothetical protein
VSDRARAFASVVSSGIILANFLTSSSSTLRDFALLHMTSSWLYAAALICGLALGITLDRISAIFYGICAMSLIAVLIFSGVLVSVALLSHVPLLDVVLLFAFQQSFPSFISIFVLGCLGAFLSMLLKLFFCRL